MQTEESNAASSTGGVYDGSQIEILEGLEAVRKRPGMYIGDTGIKGTKQIIEKLREDDCKYTL